MGPSGMSRESYARGENTLGYSNIYGKAERVVKPRRMVFTL